MIGSNNRYSVFSDDELIENYIENDAVVKVKELKRKVIKEMPLELKEKYDRQEKDYLERYNKALNMFRFADRVKQESIIWFIESLDKYRS